MSNSFIIGHITVKNPEKWAKYRSQVPATLAPWGAELLLRGKMVSVLSGEHTHTDTVVIRFPSTEAINNWHSSSAYQALVPLRQEAAEVVLLSYEA